MVVRLPGDLAPEAWNFGAELDALGFEFEPFGEGAVRVSKVPETVADAEAALVAALHALAGGEDLAKALACKGSTRFGESLSREEMEIEMAGVPMDGLDVGSSTVEVTSRSALTAAR